MILRKPAILLTAIFIALAAFAQTTTETTQTTTEPVPATTETVSTTTEEAPTTTEQTTTYYEEDDEDARDDALACGICAGVGIGIPLLGILISAFIAWWIYRDATQRGNPQAVLWAVLGFFFNILGLIIYLIARPTGPPTTAPPPAPPAPPPPTV